MHAHARRFVPAQSKAESSMQARSGSLPSNAGFSHMEQASSGMMASSLPSPSPWNVYTEMPGQQQSPAPGSYQSPGLHGLQGLDLSQISQVKCPAVVPRLVMVLN